MADTKPNQITENVELISSPHSAKDDDFNKSGYSVSFYVTMHGVFDRQIDKQTDRPEFALLVQRDNNNKIKEKTNETENWKTGYTQQMI